MNVRRLSAVKRVAHRSSIKIVTGNLAVSYTHLTLPTTPYV